jgi:N-acetylglucosamine malate deacetylase 1
MKVLVIAAHPDDAELAIGGTIAKLVKSGHICKLLIAVTPSEQSSGVSTKEFKMVRQNECEKAAEILGTEFETLNLDPYQMWFKRDLVKTIDTNINEFAPQIVFTHWNHDSHQDHVAIANATFAACRRNSISLIMYEQLIAGGITPYSFQPNIFLDITDVIQIKLKSVGIYALQQKKDRQWLKAVEGVAAFRGNQIGVQYAEAYQAVKILADIKSEGFLF